MGGVSRTLEIEGNDPNAVASTQPWNVYYGTVTKANSAAPKISKPVIAIQDFHNGCIQTGGGASCADPQPARLLHGDN
jgi:hypothetical protein